MGELKIISPLGENCKVGEYYKLSGYLKIFSEGRKDCLTEERKYILNDSHSWDNNAGSRGSGIKESLETLIRSPVYPAQ